jgi:TonB family protein
MVKMRYLCIGSVCIHGLLALSIGQYTQLSDQKISHSFSVRLLTSSKGIGENVNVSSQKNSANRAQKKSAHVISQVTTENFASAPSVIYNPAPTYPVNAKANGEEGSFSVKLLVSSAGTVKHIEVITIRGDKAPFEEELLKTMKQWTFNVNGKEASFEIPISFQLDQ